MEAIVMPDLGQTSDEAYIQEWFFKEGDRVEMGDALLSVETDKAQLDVECVAEGVLLKIVAEVDTSVQAGEVIAYVGEPGDTVPE